MNGTHHRIPNENIWLAARLTMQIHGANAAAVIGKTISDMEKQGKGELARAWSNVVAAMEELTPVIDTGGIRGAEAAPVH
jgi:hypothetical protein